MSRSTEMVDRLVTLVIAVVLIAAGVLGIVWRFDLWDQLLDRLDTTAAQDVTATDWWPWALGGVGILLILLGLRWLWAHMPTGGVGELNLPGTSSDGRLRFNAKSAAAAAATTLAETPSVHSARGNVRRDRGQMVVDLQVSMEPDADLAVVAEAADRAVADLATVMGRDDLYGRVRLSVTPRRGSSSPRVS